MGKVYVAAAADEAKIPVYGQLGLDVMSPAFTREAFGKVAARRRDQVRAFVMDKRALASVGNAYADEILFAARLHPKTFCNKLDAAALDALYAAIGQVLRDAIVEIRRRDEPIDIKVRDFLKVRGRDGKPCLVCGTTIRAVRVGDGDACFCPSCQPETRKLFINWSAVSAYRKIAPAVATLSESAPGDIGMVTRWSQASRAAADSPGPSAPSTSANRSGGRKWASGVAPGLDDGGDEREPRRRAAPPGRRASGWRARWGAKTPRPARHAPPCDRTGPRSAGTASARRRRTRRRGGPAPPGCRRRSRSSSTTTARAARGTDAGGGRSPMARQPRWT